MCLCQTELNPGILLEEMIKPNNLVLLWYQCRKPPAGCLFVSGFPKAVHIMAPGIELSYFHQNCGSERAQAGTNGQDCPSLLPLSQHISVFPTSCSWKHVVSCCCFLEISEGCSDSGIAWEMWWVYKGVSLSVASTLFAAASSKWPNCSQRSGSAVSLLLSVTPCLPDCQRCPAMCHWSYLWEKLPCVLGQCYWPAVLLQKRWEQEQWWPWLWGGESSCRYFLCEKPQWLWGQSSWALLLVLKHEKDWTETNMSSSDSNSLRKVCRVSNLWGDKR